jgi:CspA family cold shock protein
MLGIVKKLTDKGFGFISGEGLERDFFFHSNSLVGITYNELHVGDYVNFETELIQRKNASSDTIQNSRKLLPYGEQKIVPPSSSEEIKLQKKITADIIVRLSQNPTDLFRLSADEFEELIAELYVIHGYTVEMLGSWNHADGGVDILAMRCEIGTHHLRWAIQCKRYAPGNLVSAAPIRSLAGVLDRFHAHAGAIVTTSDFTRPAKKEAELFFWKVGLTNFQSLVEMLRSAELLVKPPVTFSTNRTDPPESAAVFLNAVNVQRV